MRPRKQRDLRKGRFSLLPSPLSSPFVLLWRKVHFADTFSRSPRQLRSSYGRDAYRVKCRGRQPRKRGRVRVGVGNGVCPGDFRRVLVPSGHLVYFFDQRPISPLASRSRELLPSSSSFFLLLATSCPATISVITRVPRSLPRTVSSFYVCDQPATKEPPWRAGWSYIRLGHITS